MPSGAHSRHARPADLTLRRSFGGVVADGWRVYFEQIRVLRTGVRLNAYAWNNGRGFRFCFVGFEAEIMVKRDRRGHWYFCVRGEILGPQEDRQQRRQLPRMSSLIKNESQGSEGD